MLTRRFTLPAHGAIEFLAGMVMMLGPAVLGFSAAGLVVCAFLGALLAGMGLTLSGTYQRGSAFSWHGHFDSLFGLLTAASALGLALGHDGRAAIFLAAVVLLLTFVNAGTRYATGH